MAKKKKITLAELQAALQADPERNDRMKDKERRLEEKDKACAEDEAELVREIREAGYDIDSVYALINNDPHEVLERRFLGAYPKAYPILIRHLSTPHRKEIPEGIIRALTVKDAGPELEKTLLEQFDTESDFNLRWVLANALQTAMPYHRRKKHPEIQAMLKP
jgi:uncharacterized protein (UPF0335 family)